MPVVRNGRGGTEQRTNFGEPLTVANLAKEHGPLLRRVERLLAVKAPIWYPEILALHVVCRAMIAASNAGKSPQRVAAQARAWDLAAQATELGQKAKESRDG